MLLLLFVETHSIIFFFSSPRCRTSISPIDFLLFGFERQKNMRNNGGWRNEEAKYGTVLLYSFSLSLSLRFRLTNCAGLVELLAFDAYVCLSIRVDGVLILFGTWDENRSETMRGFLFTCRAPCTHEFFGWIGSLHIAAHRTIFIYLILFSFLFVRSFVFHFKRRKSTGIK